MAKKVHKRGAIFLYFLIPGIVYTMMGFWPMLCILTVGGILAELIVGKEENYLSDSKLTLSYMIGELVYALHGIIFFLVLSKEGIDFFDADAVRDLADGKGLAQAPILPSFPEVLYL